MTFISLRRDRAIFLALAVWLISSACMRSPEAKSARFMDNGKKLVLKNDFSRAILEFQNAARATPKNPEVYYQLGLAYLGAEDVVRAVATFRKALELNPKHPGAQFQIARLMTYTDDPGIVKDGQKRLQALLEETPGNAAALHALALTELKLGETGDAMQLLARAIETSPQDVMIALTLAEAKLHEKDPRGAEEVLKRACANAPKSTDALLILARFYASQNRSVEAGQQFQRVLSINPNHGAALLNLGILQYQSGRKPEAEQTFKRVSTLPGKTLKAVYGTYLFQEGRRDEAVREFERLAKQDPEDREARTRLIAAYRAANRSADAEKVLDQALKKNGKDLDALLQRGETLLASGKYAEAEADLSRVLSLQPTSAEVHYVLSKLHQAQGATPRYRQDLSKALQLNPYLLPIRLELAQALLQSNNAGAAGNILKEVPASQKDSMPLLVENNWVLWASGDLSGMRKGIDFGLSRQRSPDLLVQDGLWKLQAGNPTGARAALEEALKLNPADLRALGALKQTYPGKQQSATALQRVKEYASRQPRSAPIQEFLGMLLLAQGDRDQARAAFTAANTADPKFETAEFSLVQMDAIDGKLDEARKRLTSILAKDGRNARARLWLGNIEEVKGDHTAAMEQFRKVVEIEPANTAALNNLAYLLSEYGNQANEALKYAEKAQELAPDNPEFADTMGWILYKKGLYPSAVQQLERAASHDKNAVWKYHLAMAYAKTGDMQRGRITLEAALRRNPNAPEAKMAQDIFSALR